MKLDIAITMVLGVCLACSQPKPNESPITTPITGIEWKLVELGGNPAPAGSQAKPVTLQLLDSERRASGFAGCNQYSSAYEMEGTTLHFTPAISTKMACEAGMDLEQTYLKAFEGTRQYRQTTNGLELIGDNDQVIARFEKP